MSPWQEQNRRPYKEMVQRRHPLLRSVPVAPLSLFKPASRQVTFEIVSPRNSPRHTREASTARHQQRTPQSALQTTSLASWPEHQSPCQIQDIPAALASPASVQTCPDQEEHDLGALLVRRTQQRHQKAWTRKRSIDPLWSRSAGQTKSIFMQCIVSGLLLMTALVVYLVLNSNLSLPTAVTVLLVLLILLCGILFLHGLFRWWILKTRMRSLHSISGHGRTRKHHARGSRRHHSHRRRGDQYRAGSTYRYPHPQSPFDILPCDDSMYTPTTPVRVHLFRDEEAFVDEKGDPMDTNFDGEEVADINLTTTASDGESPLPTPPPPAYGLWRCSVKADPNLLHWQRSPVPVCELDTPATESYFPREQGLRTQSEPGNLPTTESRRPPSYASDHALGLDSVHEEPSPTVLVEDPNQERTPTNWSSSNDNEAAVVEDDWPLRRMSGAVQEVTRMLLRDSMQSRNA